MVGTIVHVPFRNSHGEVLGLDGEYMTIYYPSLGFSEQLNTSMVDVHTSKMAEGGQTASQYIKSRIKEQKEREAGVKFPKYRVVYFADVGTKAKSNYTRIGDIDTSDSFPTILRKGLDFIEMNRSRYPVVQVKIDRFVPIEERGNPQYAYASIMEFDDKDVKGGLLKLELGGLSTISPKESVFLAYENSVVESLMSLLGIDRSDADGLMLTNKVENIVVDGFIDKLQPSEVASKIDEATRMNYYGRGGAVPIDTASIGAQSRDQDFDQTIALLRRDKIVFWSMGVSKIEVSPRERFVRLRVNGRYLNGWVYIFLNGADLYDVYFTSNRTNLRDSVKNVFAGDLLAVIDARVESDPDFKYEFKIGGVTMNKKKASKATEAKDFNLASRYAEYMRIDEIIDIAKSKGWSVDFLGGSRFDNRRKDDFQKPVVLQASFELTKKDYDLNEVKRLKDSIESQLSKDLMKKVPRLAFRDSEMTVAITEIDGDSVELLFEVVPGFAHGGRVLTAEEWASIKPFNKHIGRDGQAYLSELDEEKGTKLVPVTVLNAKGMAMGGLNVSDDLRERAAVHYLTKKHDGSMHVQRDGDMSSVYDVDKTVFTLKNKDEAEHLLRLFGTGFDIRDLREVNPDAYDKALLAVGDRLTTDEWWYEHIKEELDEIGLVLVSFDLPHHVELAYIDSLTDVCEAIMREHGETTKTYGIAREFCDEYKELVSLEDDLELQLVSVGSDEKEIEIEDEIEVVQGQKDELEAEFLQDMQDAYLEILRDTYESNYEDEYVADHSDANEFKWTYDGAMK